MRVNELIEKAQFVTDSTGKKRAVQLDYALWEELLELLEDSADGERLKNDDEQDDAWITEAINRVCAEVDTSLDPAISAMQRTWPSKEDW